MFKTLPFLFATLLVGCSQTVVHPAPTTPSKTAPLAQGVGTPSQGRSRLYIEATDGRSRVFKLRGGTMAASGTAGSGGRVSSGFLSASATVAEPICNTPCAVDLKPGNYRLAFNHQINSNKGAEVFATVGSQPSVLRITHGTSGSTAWKGLVGWPLALASGFMSFAAGAATLDPPNGERTGPMIGLGIFGGLTALGVHLIRGSKTWKQPSSSVQYALPVARRR